MVRPAIVAEKAGIPSVAIAATGFLPLAHVVGKQEGMPDIRVAEYPGTFSIESTSQMKERLEQGTFRWPQKEGACARYRREELLLLLGGLDLKQTQERKWYRREAEKK